MSLIRIVEGIIANVVVLALTYLVFVWFVLPMLPRPQ